MKKILTAIAPTSAETGEIADRWLAVADDFADGQMSVDVFIETLRQEAAEWQARDVLNAPIVIVSEPAETAGI